MSEDAQQPPGETQAAPPGETQAARPEEKHGDVIRAVARVSEPVLSAASVGFSIDAILRAVAGEIPVVGPVVGVAVTALLPILSAAIERRRKERTEHVARARSYADAAWDAIVAAR